jgi:hypothetical protein
MTGPTQNTRHLTSTILNITGAGELKEGRFDGWGQAAWTRCSALSSTVMSL